MPKKSAKFLIIDGNALVHRAYHALPEMTTTDGRLVNAAYGFTSILLKVIKELRPDYLCATFDRHGESVRKASFADYKAQRVSQGEDFYQQFPIVEEILASFDIPVIDADITGYEADDVIGSIVTHNAVVNPDLKNIILSGDLDLLQLVSDKIGVVSLKKGVSETATYDPRAVQERFGLSPEQMIDYKALRGDPSDNIPGVKGIGEITASKLLQEYKTLDNLYKNLAKAKLSDKVRAMLSTQKDQAYLSRDLVTIKTDLTTNFNLESCDFKGFDPNKVIKTFQNLEFKSLINKLPESYFLVPIQKNVLFSSSPATTVSAPAENVNYQLIDTAEKFAKFYSELVKQKYFAVDTETDSTDQLNCKLLGISFCWKNAEGYYVTGNALKTGKKDLQTILNNPEIKKTGHNLKFDFQALKNYDLDLNGIANDTMLAAYLLNSSERMQSLDDLTLSEFGYKMQAITELIGAKGKDQLTLDKIEPEKVSWYSCEDADYSWRLAKKFNLRIDPKTKEVLETIELPLIPILAEMERAGIMIDLKFLETTRKTFQNKLDQITNDIYKLAGHEFNVASPLQLKEVLFTELKISTQGLKKIKTGISTAADELEKLQGKHPIIPLLMEHREYNKLLNTYVNTLPELADSTARVHTIFNQSITATGRLSSSEPNLQNIPIRTETGRLLRQAFIAKPNYQLITADYSQVELRVAAHLSGDPKMIKTFNNHEDIHSRTAAFINHCEIDQVTKEQRRAAKEINFGVLYGLGIWGVAQRTGLPREEAKQFIDEYFAVYPKIALWIENIKLMAERDGYVETLFGRRRYLPNIHSPSMMIKAAAERMAINMPIQGTAADLIKLAMIELNKKFQSQNLKTKMLLQVHDELVFEAPLAEVETASNIIRGVMENIYKLAVPLTVGIGVGQNWDASH